MALAVEEKDRDGCIRLDFGDIPQPMSQDGAHRNANLEDSPSQSDSDRKIFGISSDFSEDGTHSSPRTSDGSCDDDISVLDTSDSITRQPSDYSAQPQIHSPFRNASSVRAMQLDTTPPHLSTSSSRRRSKICRQTREGTPTRSKFSRDKPPSGIFNSSPTKHVKKEHPLVLLHIALLPLPLQYSIEILEAVLPAPLLTNWKLLLEKTTPTVSHRGVLIPHPKEDYDLLEERLLESLELKQPRLLKCGHFHLSPEEEADVNSNDDVDEEDVLDASEQVGDICLDCGRPVRDGRFGSTGTGSKRWDVKVFAANGLMRAGAWSAAWREMERVDVEILPWMEEHVRRELDLRSEEEERHRIEEETARKEEGVGGLDDERLREIYGGDPQAYVDGLLDESDILATRIPNDQKATSSLDTPRFSKKDDVPLGDLFCRYVLIKTRDPRNLALFCLSLLVALLSLQALFFRPPLQQSVSDRGSFLGPGPDNHDWDVTRDFVGIPSDGRETVPDILLDTSMDTAQDQDSKTKKDTKFDGLQPIDSELEMAM